MPGVNFIGLNEEKSNPWKPSIKKLISPPGTSDSSIIISGSSKETFKTITPDSESTLNIYQNTITLRFDAESLKNPFKESSDSSKLIIPTFPT